MNVIFFCNASLKIGMGHAYRCLALADYLSEKHNIKINILTTESKKAFHDIKIRFPINILEIKSINYAKRLISYIKTLNAKILILDIRYVLSRKDLSIVKKETGVKIITIDDPEDKRLEADIAFYPPVPQLETMDWTEYKGELYIGWEYMILRKEFLQRYSKPSNSIPNILITMGGTDEKNITEFVVKSLNSLKKRIKAVIIVGKSYPYRKQLEKSLEKVDFDFELHQDPENLSIKMSKVDFAIISFGQTAYELAALGVPMLFLCITRDHLHSSKLFTKIGIGNSLGIYPFENDLLFLKKITNSIDNIQDLEKMKSNSASLEISNLDLISKVLMKNMIPTL